jgi:hypothetical protein
LPVMLPVKSSMVLGTAPAWEVPGDVGQVLDTSLRRGIRA